MGGSESALGKGAMHLVYESFHEALEKFAKEHSVLSP